MSKIVEFKEFGIPFLIFLRIFFYKNFKEFGRCTPLNQGASELSKVIRYLGTFYNNKFYIFRNLPQDVLCTVVHSTSRCTGNTYYVRTKTKKPVRITVRIYQVPTLISIK